MFDFLFSFCVCPMCVICSWSLRSTFMHISLKSYLSYFRLSCSLRGPLPSAFLANLILSSTSMCQILDVLLPAAHILLYCYSLCTVIYFSVLRYCVNVVTHLNFLLLSANT